MNFLSCTLSKIITKYRTNITTLTSKSDIAHIKWQHIRHKVSRISRLRYFKAYLPTLFCFSWTRFFFKKYLFTIIIINRKINTTNSSIIQLFYYIHKKQLSYLKTVSNYTIESNLIQITTSRKRYNSWCVKTLKIWLIIFNWFCQTKQIGTFQSSKRLKNLF